MWLGFRVLVQLNGAILRRTITSFEMLTRRDFIRNEVASDGQVNPEGLWSGAVLKMSDSGSQKCSCATLPRHGGCPHILSPSYLQLIRDKEALIQSACSALPVEDEIRLVLAPDTTNYRRRIRLQVQNGVVRFFNANKSHSCTVLTEG